VIWTGKALIEFTVCNDRKGEEKERGSACNETAEMGVTATLFHGCTPACICASHRPPHHGSHHRGGRVKSAESGCRNTDEGGGASRLKEQRSSYARLGYWSIEGLTIVPH